ncbi:MAG TPA: hypothetical protein PLG90_12535 [Ignavibacteria bacterium]|nr:hypothetical protein [Ignavibacteria bacterium]
MSKVIFEVNYHIKPEKRNEYFGIIEEIKKLNSSTGIDYSVYENKKNSNNFSEIYVCNSEEEFDTLEDKQGDAILDLNDKINSLLSDAKVSYSTKYEI